MTFTYAGDLGTSLDKVRFYIGDTTENAGVKPSDGNFTDEELNGLISNEGSWQAAVAAAAEVLAMLYATEVDIAVGPRRESLSQAAERYTAMGKTWRRQYARTTVSQTAPVRVDGFSQSVDAEDV